MEVSFLVGVAAEGVWAKVSPESLSVILQPMDRTVVRALLICAVTLSYLGTVISLQQRLCLLRMSHRTGLVFSFGNKKLRWSSCSLCEIV